MKKVVPTVILALIGIAVGVTAWFALFDKPPANDPLPPGNGELVVEDREFDLEKFISHFDSDGDGRISREEFEKGYGHGEHQVAISAQGGVKVELEPAWRLLDIDRDGFVTERELTLRNDARWIQHRAKTEARGLIAREWDSILLALNQPRLKAYEREKGGVARGELPFGGRWFDKKYFGEWCRVRTPAGEVYEGFLSDNGGRTFALMPHVTVHEVPYVPEVEAAVTADERVMVTEWAAPKAGAVIDGLTYETFGQVVRAMPNGFEHEGFIRREKGKLRVAVWAPRLRIVKRDECEITPLPQAPQAQYIEQVRKLKLQDADGALALAKRCREWGMEAEALNMYMRALVFKPDVADALAYWGIEVKDEQYYPRK
ncbi:MAG: hypothetical protein IT464_16725 [Planctomycetes bacterium]|nr:hypothetical protein [Planctomycetota bacterium]